MLPIKIVLGLLENLGLDAKSKDIHTKLSKKIRTFFKNKKPGDIDIPEVRKIKTLTRKGESKSACRFVGVPEKNIHFLEMPFYETGTIKKGSLEDQDIQLIVNLLKEIEGGQDSE